MDINNEQNEQSVEKKELKVNISYLIFIGVLFTAFIITLSVSNYYQAERLEEIRQLKQTLNKTNMTMSQHLLQCHETNRALGYTFDLLLSEKNRLIDESKFLFNQTNHFLKKINPSI